MFPINNLPLAMLTALSSNKNGSSHPVPPKLYMMRSLIVSGVSPALELMAGNAARAGFRICYLSKSCCPIFVSLARFPEGKTLVYIETMKLPAIADFC
jgi:hypothetical protein